MQKVWNGEARLCIEDKGKLTLDHQLEVRYPDSEDHSSQPDNGRHWQDLEAIGHESGASDDGMVSYMSE